MKKVDSIDLTKHLTAPQDKKEKIMDLQEKTITWY
jgi:hypothetical protein